MIKEPYIRHFYKYFCNSLMKVWTESSSLFNSRNIDRFVKKYQVNKDTLVWRRYSIKYKKWITDE